jgi:hypothetical protein
MPAPAPRFCTICSIPVGSRKFFCPRCKTVLGNRFHHRLMVPALQDALDRTINRFRCRYCGAVLNETGDPYHPFYLTVDHVVPGEEAIVISSFLMNDMKSDLTGDEFVTVVPAVDDTLLGIAPFNKNIIAFRTWNRVAPALAAPRRHAHWEISRAPVVASVVCGRMPFPGSIYCPTCRGIINQRWEIAARASALKKSWNPVLQAYTCYYTGAILNVTDPNSPWFIVFDHLIPGQKGNLVACAAWVNAMKTYLTGTEFRAVIHSLAEHIRHGTPFDKSLVDEKRFGLARRLGKRVWGKGFRVKGLG